MQYSISTYKNLSNISLQKKLKMYFINEYICKRKILYEEAVIDLLKISGL